MVVVGSVGGELTWSWVNEVVEVGSGVLGRLETFVEVILGGYLYLVDKYRVS